MAPDALPKRKKSEVRRRTVLICVRLLPEELEIVQKRAGGKPVSTYLRELALADPPKRDQASTTAGSLTIRNGTHQAPASAHAQRPFGFAPAAHRGGTDA